MRVADAKQVKNPFHMRFVNHADVVNFQRMAKNREPAGFMPRQGAAQVVHVEAFDVPRQVGDGDVFHAVDFNGDVGVAQGEVEVEQGHAVRRVGGQGGGEVDGQSCGTDAAAGSEYGD